MPNYRITYFFKDGKSAGWTENFYAQGDSSEAVHSLFVRDALVNARLGFLAEQYFLGEVRTSNTDAARDSLVTAYSGNSGKGKFKTQQDWALDPAEEPYDALLVRIEAGSTHRRQLYVRGLPTDVVAQNREYVPQPEFAANFKKWADIVKANGTPFRLRSLTFGDDVVPFATTVSATGDSFSVSFGLNPVPTWAKGDIIRVRRAVGVSNLNGMWKVDAVLSPVVYFKPHQRLIRGAIVGNPFLQKATEVFTAVTDVIPERGTSRKTGRPFDVLRGRARVRRS